MAFVPVGDTPMSKLPRRTFSREFKLQVVHQLLTGERRLAQLCREHNLSATLVRRWKDQYESHGEEAWPAPETELLVAQDPQARIRALEAALGRAHLENEFLREALAALRKGGSAPTKNGR